MNLGEEMENGRKIRPFKEYQSLTSYNLRFSALACLVGSGNLRFKTAETGIECFQQTLLVGFSQKRITQAVILSTLWRPCDTINGRCTTLYNFLDESISSTYCSFIISRHKPGRCHTISMQLVTTCYLYLKYINM